MAEYPLLRLYRPLKGRKARLFTDISDALTESGPTLATLTAVLFSLTFYPHFIRSYPPQMLSDDSAR